MKKSEFCFLMLGMFFFTTLVFISVIFSSMFHEVLHNLNKELQDVMIFSVSLATCTNIVVMIFWGTLYWLARNKEKKSAQ